MAAKHNNTFQLHHQNRLSLYVAHDIAFRGLGNMFHQIWPPSCKGFYMNHLGLCSHVCTKCKHVRLMQSSTGRFAAYWCTIQNLQYVTFHVCNNTRHAKSSLSSGFSATVSQRERLGDEPACNPAMTPAHGSHSLSLSLSLSLSCFLLWRKSNQIWVDEPRLHPQRIALATSDAFSQFFLGTRRTKGKEFETGMHHLRLHLGIHSLTQRLLQTDLPLVSGAGKNRGSLRIHEVTRIQIARPGDAERATL